MRSLHRMFGAAALAGFLAAAPASAQIVNSPDVNGLRTFLDQSTNRTWLDLDNFFNQTPNQMLVTANAAGFTLASAADVQQLVLTLPLGGGQWASYAAIMGQAPNRNLIWGMWDSGTQGSQAWTYAYDTDAAWQTQPNTGINWNTVPNGNSPDADLDLWAFRLSPPPPPLRVLLGRPFRLPSSPSFAAAGGGDGGAAAAAPPPPPLPPPPSRPRVCRCFSPVPLPRSAPGGG